MALLDDVKLALRITSSAFDSEVQDLIYAAKADLRLSGVDQIKTEDDTDPLIKRAIVTYVKANFGWDNQEAERFQQAYYLLKMHLASSLDYTGGDPGAA